MTRSNWGTWALWLLLIGCGEQSIEPVNGGSTGGSGGSTGGRGGANGVGGGRTGGAGGVGGGAAGGSAGQAGVDAGAFNPPVWVAAWQSDTEWEASVYGANQTDPQKRCYTRVIGPCTATDCRTSKYGAGGIVGAGLGPVSFGSAGADIVLSPDANNLYAPSAFVGHHWSEGDDVLIHSAGGALPAFSATVKMPGPLTMFSLPGADLDTQSPLELSWLPTDGYAQFAIHQWPGYYDGQVRNCLFPAQDGKATIPVEVFEGLEPGKDTVFATDHWSLQEVSVGDRIVWAFAGYPLRMNVNIK
jgi:hypothetical protein